MADEFLRIERDDELAIWWMDAAGERHNKLSSGVLQQIERALDEAASDDGIAAVIAISAKPDSFIVGADVREIESFERREDAERLSRHAHALLRKVMRLGKPIVAAIHGAALGGGLEFALACSSRIATDHASTKFALPEVQLGLLPAGGGTQLLPRLIGIQRSLPLLLTGKNIYPRPGRKIGLVDALIHRPGLLHAARQVARKLAETGVSRRDGPTAMQEKLLESNPFTRRIIYSKAEERVRKETRGNYPAPPRIIDCIRTGMEDGLDAGLSEEERHFADLAMTPQSRELVRLFFARIEAQKNPFAGEERAVDQIGVLGAGLMGSGIAQVSAENGINVIVKDRTMNLAANARKQVYESATRQAGKGALSEFERDVILARVTVTDTYAGFENVDLVIEAAPEDIDLKTSLIQEVEAICGPDCIFASNTSSIPISTLARGSARPDHIIGMHYFSPVQRVPLLEIIRKSDTPDWILATAVDVGLKQGKSVVVVSDGPGFYTTRTLSIYMNEALNLLDEGESVERIDQSILDFGFPMGPFELFDLVGIDVASKITAVLSDFFSERGILPNRKADRLVEAGIAGRKTGGGFYDYSGNKRKDVNEDIYRYFGGKDRQEIPTDAIQTRLVLAFCNEAVNCLEEGILGSARDGDVGAVFGLGFPPFRGGPFRYVDAFGAANLVKRLEQLRATYGEQFAPSSLLTEYASSGRSFG